MLSPPCDPIRLYVHAVCTSGWGPEEGGKGSYWLKYKLWLVDEDGQPLYLDNENTASSGKSAHPAHPFLTCRGPAWMNM